MTGLVVGSSLSFVGEAQVGDTDGSAGVTDALETRAYLHDEREDESDIRSAGAIGNVLSDAPAAVVVWLLEEWAPEFDEGRNDDVYINVEAAVALDDLATRVYLDVELEDESDIRSSGAIGNLLQDGSAPTVESALLEQHEEFAEFDEPLVYQQVIDEPAAPADDSETRVWLEDAWVQEERGDSTGISLGFDVVEIFYLAQELLTDVEQPEYDDETFVFQQFIEDAAVVPDAHETRIYLHDERDDESDIRSAGAIGNLLVDAVFAEIEPLFIEQYEDIPELVEYAVYQQAIDEPPPPPPDDSETRALLEDIRAPEELGELAGNALGFAVEEIFYLAQELFAEAEQLELEDAVFVFQQSIEDAVVVPDASETRVYLEELQHEVEWVEEQVHQFIEDAQAAVDDLETRPTLWNEDEYPEDYAFEELLAQIIENPSAPPDTPGQAHIHYLSYWQ